jgi:hypothetical protein
MGQVQIRQSVPRAGDGEPTHLQGVEPGTLDQLGGQTVVSDGHQERFLLLQRLFPTDAFAGDVFHRVSRFVNAERREQASGAPQRATPFRGWIGVRRRASL